MNPVDYEPSPQRIASDQTLAILAVLAEGIPLFPEDIVRLVVLPADVVIRRLQGNGPGNSDPPKRLFARDKDGRWSITGRGRERLEKGN